MIKRSCLKSFSHLAMHFKGTAKDYHLYLEIKSLFNSMNKYKTKAFEDRNQKETDLNSGIEMWCHANNQRKIIISCFPTVVNGNLKFCNSKMQFFSCCFKFNFSMNFVNAILYRYYCFFFFFQLIKMRSSSLMTLFIAMVWWLAALL